MARFFGDDWMYGTPQRMYSPPFRRRYDYSTSPRISDDRIFTSSSSNSSSGTSMYDEDPWPDDGFELAAASPIFYTPPPRLMMYEPRPRQYSSKFKRTNNRVRPRPRQISLKSKKANKPVSPPPKQNSLVPKETSKPVPPPPAGFELVQKLGRGGEGATDIIRRKSDDQLRVCKIFFFPGEYWDGLPREVKILREMIGKHDRIVRLLDFEIDSDKQLTVYYEWCAGGDLCRFLKGSRGVREDVLWHVFLQMGEALAYLHHGFIEEGVPIARGWQPIVHCDFKPSNIFVRTRACFAPARLPDLILGDFGFADPRASSQDGGTPAYSPPEYPINTAAGDIWALGSTIHELGRGHTPLRGKPKWYKEGMRNWLKHPRSRKVKPLPPCYDEQTNKHMMHCLEKEPHKRPTSLELVRSVRKSYPKQQ